jgi:hypothetical protein
VLLVGGAVLAKRNLRLGRGDRRGAQRLASAMFTLGIAGWLLACHHVADPGAQLVATLRGVGLAAVGAGVVWLFYLALEPYVRRERPWTIVSWTRLLEGGVRDAVVWRDVLYGVASGVALTLAADLLLRLPVLVGRPEPRPTLAMVDALLGLRPLAAFVVSMPIDAALVGLGLLLLFLVLRLVLRRDLPAALSLVLLLSTVGLAASLTEGSEPLWLSLPVMLFAWSLVVTMLLRFGLLVTIVGIWVSDILGQVPHSLDVDSWKGGATVVVVPLVLAVAVYAFRRASHRTAHAGAYASAESSASRSA